MADSIPENVTLSIDPDKRRISFVQTGELNRENALETARLIMTAEGFDPTFNTLVDYRGIEKVNVGATEILEISTELRKFDTRVGKIALVTGDNTSRYILAKLFIEVGRMTDTPYTYNVFKTMEDAEAWLGAEP